MSLVDHPRPKSCSPTPFSPRRPCGVARIGSPRSPRRYLPHFYRAEQRAAASLVIGGPLSGLQRKTCEPIAVEAGVHRKPIQFFVGAGKRHDEAVVAELRRHVAEE